MLILPQYLYHGTSLPRIESILSKGLLPKSQRNGSPRIYLTNDIESAKSYGKSMAQWDKEETPKKERKIKFKATIIKIPTHLLLEEGFVLGRGLLDIGDSLDKSTKPTALNKKQNWTWEELFQETGTVGYQYTIKLSKENIFQI